MVTDYTNEKIFELLKTEHIHSKHPYNSKKTNGKTVNLSLGRIFLNVNLPEDYPLINKPIQDSQLQEIVKDLYNKYPLEEATKTISNLTQNAFKLGTISPSSLDIDTFIPSSEWTSKKENFRSKAKNYPPNKFSEEASNLTNELLDDLKTKEKRITILNTVAKGSTGDWQSLMTAKGYTTDLENGVHGPITQSISDGYGKKDYFDACNEARKNFYYKSSLTAIPGYLSRKLAMSLANVSIDPVDCKAKKYFEVLVDKKNITKLTGRYMYLDGNLHLTDVENLTPFLNKKIQIRSPLYCRSTKNKICKVCFGELASKLDTKNIGIATAGAINLITINSLMKLRHKTSHVNAKPVNFLEILKNTNINLKMLEKYLDLSKPNQISCKLPCKIALNMRDYSDTEVIETEKYFQLPGIITLIVDEKIETDMVLPFDFPVKIFKAMDTETSGKYVYFNYQTKEKMIEQDLIFEDVDPNVIRKIFDAGFKYLKTPETLVWMINKHLPNLDLVHAELVVQNSFRSNDNQSILGRYVGYKNCTPMSQKQIPFVNNSFLNNLSFENLDKGLKIGLLTHADIANDPYEKIISEYY